MNYSAKHSMKWIYLTTSFAFVSCASHPEPFAGDQTAQVSTPNSFQSKALQTPEIATSLTKLFSIPALTSTVHLALNNNTDIKIAAAMLKEAGYNFEQSKAPLLPTVSHSAGLGRDFTNSSGATGNYYQGFNASWEVDLWGQIRAGVNAGASDQDAAQLDLEAARQSIAAQTMQAWFTMAENTALLEIAQRRKKSFEQTLNLLEKRFDAGTSDLSAIDLAKVDVENAQALMAQRQNSKEEAARALQVLCGQYPSIGQRNATFGSLKRGVKPGVPSQVLMRRPDIRAAYNRILAADSRVTIAHADQFPNFTLTSSLGTSGSQLGNLARSGFTTFSVLGDLTTPLIDNGKRKAELGAASARAEQAYFSYQKTLLTAFSEVENALAAESALLKRQTYTQKALNASRDAESRIKRQYEAGTVEILTYLDTQRRKFTSEEELTSLRAARYRNRVALALAAGIGI